jgi:hypothetical protein
MGEMTIGVRRDIVRKGVGILEHMPSDGVVITRIIEVVHLRAHETAVFLLPVIIPVISLPTTVLIIIRDASENFKFTAEDHSKAFASDRFINAGKGRTIAPFVQFPTERVRLELEDAKFPGSEDTVSAGRVDMCDGRVDDRGFRRTTDLGQVW